MRSQRFFVALAAAGLSLGLALASVMAVDALASDSSSFASPGTNRDLGLATRALAPAAALEITQTQKLTASDGANFHQFGLAVALSGDTAVVGANQDFVSNGAAYIFGRNEGGADNWGEVKILTASDGAFDDQFGISVTIDGDLAVVGAPNDNSDQGAAYIFGRNQAGVDNWGQVKKLTASDGAPSHLFGIAVAIKGDTIVVGASQANGNAGAAYIFGRNEGGADNWGEVKILTASDGASGDQLGEAVALAGITVVAGARGDDGFQGAAYVFERDQGGLNNWGEVQKLIADVRMANDSFGDAVTLSGDTVAVGVPGDDDLGNGSGSVFVFGRNQGGVDNWGQLKKLTASDGTNFDQFGFDLALDGNRLLVGAAGDGPGSAYLFERNQAGANNWGELDRFSPDDGVNGDAFGNAVALTSGTSLIGASAADSFRGAAYVLVTSARLYLPIVLKS